MKKLLTLSFILICIGCGQHSNNTTTTANDSTANLAASEECNDAIANKKIQDSLQPRIILEFSEEEYKELMADTPLQGLQSFQLDTVFNEHCLLCIKASGEWSAAYVSEFERYRCFDKHTGNRLMIKDLLKADSLNPLFRKFYEAARETAKDHREEILGDDEIAKEIDDYDTSINISLREMKIEDLEDFYINKDGITFIHEWGFGHASWNIEPNKAEFHLSRQELLPYIKPGGPLSYWLKP